MSIASVRNLESFRKLSSTPYLIVLPMQCISSQDSSAFTLNLRCIHLLFSLYSLLLYLDYRVLHDCFDLGVV